MVRNSVVIASKAGKELGVSDNAIRKFLKKHELSR